MPVTVFTTALELFIFLYLEATAFDYFLLCFALLALSTSSYVWLTLNLQMAHSHFHKSHTIFTSLTALLWAGLSSLYQMMVAGEDTPESYLKDSVDWMLKKSLLAIEFLITGTVFQRTVLVALC